MQKEMSGCRANSDRYSPGSNSKFQQPRPCGVFFYRYDGTPIPRVNSSDYPGPPWKTGVPPLEIYAWRGERMLSKASWKGKCFQCIWANMANVTVQYDFDKNLVRNRCVLFFDKRNPRLRLSGEKYTEGEACAARSLFY